MFTKTTYKPLNNKNTVLRITCMRIYDVLTCVYAYSYSDPVTAFSSRSISEISGPKETTYAWTKVVCIIHYSLYIRQATRPLQGVQSMETGS